MSSGSTGGFGSDCEGEEQEDPSSSLSAEEVDCDAVARPNIQEQVGGHDELSSFRQQWQRELEASPQNGTPNNAPENAVTDATLQQNVTSDFEKARSFFMVAADLERAGRWYESIQNYKRAMAINPNIELLLYQQGVLDMVEDITPEEEAPPVRPGDDEEEGMVDGEDLLSRIQRIQGQKGVLCEPAMPNGGAHISCLPYEVVLLITRWVVSSELDATALERLGATCRGLYLVARDQDIWRNICIRTWGIECGTPRVHGFGSWRQMYIERPRLQLHGCYISRTNYLRHGETGFQDQFYRPWYLVQYYRYLRFFPDGQVTMLTTPEEPSVSVGQLRNRNVRPAHGLMVGHYRLRGDKVIIVMKKSSPEKRSSQAASSRSGRHRRRRDHDRPERDQTFHIELQLSSSASRRNSRLSWKDYSVCSFRDQWTEFTLCPGKFPPFYFSRVRHYTRETGAPLASVAYSSLPAVTA